MSFRVLVEAQRFILTLVHVILFLQIIPLAKKLRDCNIFGVSSDECLNYAQRNRDEWEECGREYHLIYDMRVR